MIFMQSDTKHCSENYETELKTRRKKWVWLWSVDTTVYYVNTFMLDDILVINETYHRFPESKIILIANLDTQQNKLKKASLPSLRHCSRLL